MSERWPLGVSSPHAQYRRIRDKKDAPSAERRCPGLSLGVSFQLMVQSLYRSHGTGGCVGAQNFGTEILLRRKVEPSHPYLPCPFQTFTKKVHHPLSLDV